jgi:hypothetical protein
MHVTSGADRVEPGRLTRVVVEELAAVSNCARHEHGPCDKICRCNSQSTDQQTGRPNWELTHQP